MLDDLYSNALLEAAANMPPARHLVNPDATVKKISRVCGSEISVEMNMSEGPAPVVTDFALIAKACALGQASASIVANNIIGASAIELRQVRDEMRAMLKEDGPVPSGDRWSDLSKLAPIKEYQARHASTLLVFEAVVACLEIVSNQSTE